MHEDNNNMRVDQPRSVWWRPALNTAIPFAIVALSCIALTWLLVSSLKTEHRERAQATRTLSVLWMVRDVNRPFMTMESSQRGYLLTRDTAYLIPYDQARVELDQALNVFSSEIDKMSDEKQQARSLELRRLLSVKVAEMEETIRLEKAGDREAALAIVNTNSGESLSAEYRATRNAIEQQERAAHLKAFENAERISGRLLPLLGLLVLTTFAALIFGFRQILRAARVEGDARELALVNKARERSDLLARELNHRVKNLFAIVQSIVRMTARRETDAEQLANKIGDRINALAIAHQVSQGALEKPVADLRSLIEATLAPYDQQGRLKIDGPPVELTGPQTQPVGLILHELVTNAVKYGAWCTEAGALTISWTVEDAAPPIVRLTWQESGVTALKSGPDGFGTQMMSASARQLGGKIERRFEHDRMTAFFSFPLR